MVVMNSSVPAAGIDLAQVPVRRPAPPSLILACPLPSRHGRSIARRDTAAPVEGTARTPGRFTSAAWTAAPAAWRNWRPCAAHSNRPFRRLSACCLTVAQDRAYRRIYHVGAFARSTDDRLVGVGIHGHILGGKALNAKARVRRSCNANDFTGRRQ
jgi:hypothetical protein